MKHKRLHRRAFKLRHFIILGFLCLVLCLSIVRQLQHSHDLGQPGLYAISHFIDGDTIAVNMNGQVQSIRLIGVDTPETHKPNSPVQCFGMSAAAFTKQTIGHSSVRLEADPLDTNRDRYNRLLRYVYLPDGTLLNEQLIAKGYGFAYTQFPFSKKAAFATDQSQAQTAGSGLWSACHPYQEPSGRWQTENLSD